MPVGPDARRRKRRKGEGITAISVCGYKSLHSECRVEVRPLTILAGANSSGKSSIVQPLLLLKQTLDASYDPGPLMIDGPNVSFTSVDQFLSAPLGQARRDRFTVGLAMGGLGELSWAFSKEGGKEEGQGLAIEEFTHALNRDVIKLRPQMTPAQIRAVIPPPMLHAPDDLSREVGQPLEWCIRRDRCFLELCLRPRGRHEPGGRYLRFGFSRWWPFEVALREIIHVPGLRGNPERTYNRTGVGPDFPGLFQEYVASVIYAWQSERDERLAQLGRDLEKLGLTWKVRVQPVGETKLELRVGRLPHSVRGGARDLVSMADVGFGVSQALPVVVALLTAKPGQLVYLEQPEIHLHPRAQVAMAELLAAAAQRGVRVIAETHSALLLLAIQTLVARGQLPRKLVKLHWFRRDPKSGATEVIPGELDKDGAFRDWPVDFGDVELEAQRAYLDAGR